MNFVGLSVASGIVYYGVLTAPSAAGTLQYVADAPEKLAPQSGGPDAVRLADAYGRINQDFRALAPCRAVVVGTRLHGHWPYRSAFDRASMITIILLACAELAIECEEWSTEKIEKLIDVPAKDLASLDFKEIGFSARPKFWNAGRGDAFAAAKAVALTQAA